MAEIIVTSTADSGAGSLRQAIADAQDGDVILFDVDIFPSNQTTTILLSSTLSIAKDIEVDGDGRVEIDGQNATRCMALYGGAHVKNLTIRNGATTNGAGVLMQGGTPTMTDCVVEDCNATSVCGGVYFTGSVIATLNNCTIRNCTAGANGGGVYFNNTSQVTLNDCVITGSTANSNGGGIYAAGTSQATLNDCLITNCTAETDGGGVFFSVSSQGVLNRTIVSDCSAGRYYGGLYINTKGSITLTNCTTTGNTAPRFDTGDVGLYHDCPVTITDSQFDAMFIQRSAPTTISGALSTVGKLSLPLLANGTPQTVTFLDGAALAVTANTSIPSGTTFTSETRGYFAVNFEANVSDATFNNVILCDYNPDKTYYYVGGTEGSFADPADWSLSKGGTALRYAPIADGYVFVVETGENDVAIAKGSETFSGATVVLSGPTAVSATVDVATFDVESFAGTLNLTGDVAITGDASTLDVTVSGTLRVAGNQKISTLILAEDSNVVFSAADDILAVTTLATLNNAVVACPDPVAFFSAPEGTDGTAATFNNVVFSVGAGAGVTDVTGVKAGKNYTINITATDNTKPVVVEYKGAEDSEWTVVEESFVGSTYTMKSDDVLTFRVYDGENFTTATIKNYGVYNAAREVVVVGYLKTSSQAGYVN